MVRDRRSAVSLQKPSDPAVGDGAQQAAVRGDADDCVVVLGGLGLGEAYPAIFGIDEAAAGHHIVGACRVDRPVQTAGEDEETGPAKQLAGPVSSS